MIFKSSSRQIDRIFLKEKLNSSMSVGGLLSLWKSIKVDRFWKIQAVNEVNFLWKTRAQISFGSWELLSNFDHHDNTIEEHIGGLFQLQNL